MVKETLVYIFLLTRHILTCILNPAENFTMCWVLIQKHPWKISERHTNESRYLYISNPEGDIQCVLLYRALKHHPDKGGDPEEFKDITIAYVFLIYLWSLFLGLSFV